MTEFEFFPYHNRHIVFKLKNGQELSGVLIDPGADRQNGQSRTIYKFIPTKDLMWWKRAVKENNQDRMKIFESKKIDIDDILWAEGLNY